MTSANVLNLNSVKQGQVLNANAAKGRSKAENPDAAGVFASLMGSNYSTNFNMPSVDTKKNNNVFTHLENNTFKTKKTTCVLQVALNLFFLFFFYISFLFYILFYSILQTKKSNIT